MSAVSHSQFADAVQRGHVEIIKAAFASGFSLADYDSYGTSALSRATREGHVTTMEVLIQHGADVNQQDSCGRTPLHRAAEKDFTVAIRLLVEKGAVVDKLDASENTPLETAVYAGYLRSVRTLIASGASTGDALCLAVQICRPSIAEALIAAGANINGVNRIGLTPLTLATREKCAECVALLLLHGANANPKDFYQTPLMCASIGDHLHIVRLLVSAGASLFALDNRRRNALEIANDYNRRDIVYFLEWPYVHSYLVDWTLALSSLELPAYVLLWTFDWLTESTPVGQVSEYKKINCIVGVINSIRRVRAARAERNAERK